jgi:hypothetical protein
MPDVSAQEKATALRNLRGAIDEVVALRNATNLKKGYLNFDHAEKILRTCREALATTADKERIVSILATAHDALELCRAGDAAPAVKSAQKAIKNLLAGFEVR